MKSKLTISIISHGQYEIIKPLLKDLNAYKDYIDKVILTFNIPEKKSDNIAYDYKIKIIENEIPLGFGANNNQAFKYCYTETFCIINPDIRIESDIFREILQVFDDKLVAMVAPLIIDNDGNVENARDFPTFKKIIFDKALLRKKESYILSPNNHTIFPDWVAGSFIFFDSEKFKNLGGFNIKYFMYYEDVDICTRAWKENYKVAMNTSLLVKHYPRKNSHKNLKYFYWHIKSFLFYMFKHIKKPIKIIN
jgi:N-acetylglucosaminyl-diphospho-decaprenol L-rhamnosyltransferase